MRQHVLGCLIGNAAITVDTLLLYRYVGTPVEYQSGNLGSAAIEFDAVDYIEIYDYSTDKWAQQNLINSTGSAAKEAMKAELHKWYQCKGQECP